MEVANDGGLFGPEETKIQLNISIKGDRVFYELDDVQSELALIDKLGTANLLHKGGLAAMQTLHVWKQVSSDKYEVQYSTNYARSITIRTGDSVCDIEPAKH